MKINSNEYRVKPENNLKLYRVADDREARL